MFKKEIQLFLSMNGRKEEKGLMNKVKEKLNNELIQIIHTLPDLYLFLSPDFSILDATDAYLNATLTIRENIIGKNLFEVFPDNPDKLKSDATRNLRYSLEQVLLLRKSHTMAIQQYDIPKPTGGFETKFWRPINTPVINSNLEVEYIIHKVIDVTNETHLERENKNRIEKVDKANIELAGKNETLTENNDALTHTNKDLGVFIYTVSHDLKSPLSNMEGLLALLKETIKTSEFNRDEIDEVIGMMNDSLLRFKERITELSDTIKKETNLANCKEIIHEVMLDIQDLIHQAKAEIHIDVSDCPEIPFSPKNLKSIIHNLLTNAIKYHSFDRTPIVTIWTEKLKDYVLLNIKDNGLGIDLKNSTDIFSKFERQHDHIEGTGLGLYIVKSLIENNGGKIEVESEIGVGTYFKVYFKDFHSNSQKG